MSSHARSNANTKHVQGRRGTVIQITTTPQLLEVLDRIVETGFYGTSRAAAAERLLSEGIRTLLREGLIQKRQKAME